MKLCLKKCSESTGSSKLDLTVWTSLTHGSQGDPIQELFASGLKQDEELELECKSSTVSLSMAGGWFQDLLQIAKPTDAQKFLL